MQNPSHEYRSDATDGRVQKKADNQEELRIRTERKTK